MKSSTTKTVGREAEVDSTSPLATELCVDLELPALEMPEIYRYLGYPFGTVPGPRIDARVEEFVVASRAQLEPRGTFAIYSITQRRKGSLDLGSVTILGDIAEFMVRANRVAAFVVTVGERISAMATTARANGDALAAFVIDTVGSWAAETTADVLMGRIERHLRPAEALTLRYSPGYCGMEISEQQKLFRLVRADSAGVSLLGSMVMQPLKSISGLVGIGPADAIIRFRSACERCPQVGCHMRR